MLALPYLYNWQKFNNKMNESQEYQSMDPEYVTGEINSPILELFYDEFVVWVLHHLENLNILQYVKAFSQRPQKIF